jgi:hypothetical protein
MGSVFGFFGPLGRRIVLLPAPILPRLLLRILRFGPAGGFLLTFPASAA